MENAEARITQRFFRKTIAHPDGSVVHHGDCDYFNIKICTCGLLHDLMPVLPEIVERLYPSYVNEEVEQENARMILMERSRPKAPKKKKKRPGDGN